MLQQAMGLGTAWLPSSCQHAASPTEGRATFVSVHVNFCAQQVAGCCLGCLRSGLNLGAGAMSQVKRAKHEVDDDTGSARSSRGWTVSPAQLREALSRINHAAIHFELSEMHDAAEVRPCWRSTSRVPQDHSVHSHCTTDIAAQPHASDTAAHDLSMLV